MKRFYLNNFRYLGSFLVALTILATRLLITEAYVSRGYYAIGGEWLISIYGLLLLGLMFEIKWGLEK